MSRVVLFEIGAVIFVAVVTAVFLYGLAVFRELQVRDESATELEMNHPSLAGARALPTEAAPGVA